MFLSKNKNIDFKKKFMLEKTVNEWHSLSSLHSYESLFYHIENDPKLDLQNISETFNLDNVLEFFQRNSQKWTESNYNFYIKKIRVFLKFLYREWVISDFDRFLKFKKEDNKLPKSIEKDELEKIFEILDEEERRIMRFFLYSWVRRFEFCKISEKDISLEKREIKIFWKWRKERIIPVHHSIIDDVSKMHFPYKLSKIDGIRQKIQEKFPKFRIHNLRHTFATTMIRAKADLYATSQIMWHSTIDTTTIYLSLDSSNARKEIDKIFFNI